MANPKKSRDPQEKLAGYLYDISKLTFAALVLGAFTPIISGNAFDWKVVLGGFGCHTINRIQRKLYNDQVI